MGCRTDVPLQWDPQVCSAPEQSAGDLVCTEDEQIAEQLVSTEAEQSAGDSPGTADSKLPTRENTVSTSILLRLLVL